MSLASEFGEFGEDDESVTGLKAAAKAKKGPKKKKPKKKEILEASENPLSNSEDEEDALPEGTPPEKSKKKPKNAKKKKPVAEFTDLAIGSDGEDDIEAEIASRVTEAQVKAAMGGKKTKKRSKKELKAATSASDMANPMADDFDGEDDEGADEDGGEEQSVGATLGIDTGKKKQPIVSRYVRAQRTGQEWALAVYKDEGSADRSKPLQEMKLAGAVLQFVERTVEGHELHCLIAGKDRLRFTKAADKDVGKVDKHTGKTTFLGQMPIEMMVAFVELLLSRRVKIVNAEGEIVGSGGVSAEDITVTYNHEGSQPPDLVWREHESGFLRVDDAFGRAAKCPGMKLGLELRMVAGRRVGGIPQSVLKQIVQGSPSPVEMVFIDPGDEDEESSSAEEEEDEPVECVFHEAGSIGIVFDEGEEEDTVVIESIKKGTPASRKYGAQLEAGMLLTKCRGVDCAPLDFDGIIELLQDPARPLALTFEFLYEEESDG